MKLLLAQHGKSLPADVDPRKGLSEEGVTEVERIARMACGYGVRIPVIKHSGKNRAVQTAQIFARELEPSDGILQQDGINPLDDVVPIAKKLGTDDVMLVGHLPFMERLTSYLITGSTDKPVFKFQNGGIVCLECDDNIHVWVIKWALLPNVE